MIFSVLRRVLGHSQPPNTAAPPPPVRCQICGSTAPLLDSVDFNKACNDGQGQRLPSSGTRIDYHLCVACGFCFAPEIQGWSRATFSERIYNDAYVLVDPDYVRDRPIGNANQLHDAFGHLKLRHLDYGGGSGLLSATLRDRGWNSTSYDPFVNVDQRPGELGRFDLVTAFEVFEHVPDVQALLDDLDVLCTPEGLILFSTLVSDGQVALGSRLTWWYAAPRNGHISLFSSKSLARWLSGKGFTFASIDHNVHVAFRQLPSWASHLRLSHRAG